VLRVESVLVKNGVIAADLSAITDLPKDVNLKEVENLYSNFQFLDKNGDGKMDRQEFINGLGFLGIQDSLFADILFKEFDKNGDGIISWSEFLH